MSDDIRFGQVSFGHPLLGLLPLCSLLFLLYVTRSHNGRQSTASKLWGLPPLALLCAVTIWYALGIGASDLLALALFCVVACACGVAARCRRELVNALPPRLRTTRIFLATTVSGVLALEFTWNEQWYTLGPQFVLVEMALVGGVLATLWLLGGRRGIGPALGIMTFAAIGTVQHYVLEFRGTSILPSDIFAMGTALSVSGGYTYGLTSIMLVGFSALLLGVTCASLLWPSASHVRRLSFARDLAMAAGTAALTSALVFVPNYATTFGAYIDYWWSKDWYGRQGFLPSFIFAWQDLAIAAPAGYTPKAADEAEHDLIRLYEARHGGTDARTEAQARFEQTKPNIIVIQNETFCDLSTFAQLQNGYEGPSFWNEGLDDALARGSFAVSVFGGGTCNTEFEFLTGSSLAFVGTSKYPFTMYDLSVCDSLPRQLAAYGYHCVGMHPNLASNWNRDRAYQQLGFTEFLSEDDFEDAEQYHTHVSDRATYERALDLIESSKEPLFVFDVTMQNHSGYDTGSIPNQDLPGYRIAGLSEADTYQLNEYLACIAESDRALEELVAALDSMDEPTVVVMYGDHHPWFSEALNDLLFAHEDPLEHAERVHQTTYVMWANYEVPITGADASEPNDTSADMLAAMTLEAVGAPLTDFQQAQLGARAGGIRSLNANGLLGSDAQWHPLNDPGPYANLLHELELVEYRNFGSKV